MGCFAPSNRDKELRVEKLYLMGDLAEGLDGKEFLSLDEYLSFFWQFCPARTEHARIFLEDLIKARREGRRYTHVDFARFKKVCRSGNNRRAILDKLIHLGVVEKRNKTTQDYEIVLIDKWIERLEYLIRSWVMLTR